VLPHGLPRKALPRSLTGSPCRDLLVRHEKLVHFNEANKDGQPAPGGMIPQTPAPLQTSPAYTAQTPAFSAPTPSLIDPDLLQPGSFSGQMANPMPTLSAKSPESYRTPGCSLDLLSDAANHLATSGHHLPSMMQEPLSDGRGGMMMNGGHTGMQYDTRMDQDTPMRNSGYQAMGPSGGLEDYNLFLDDFGLSSHYFLPMYDTEMPSSFWSRPPLLSQESAGQAETKPQLLHDGQEAHNSFSRFGSRLPSLQPEVRDGSDNHQLPEEITRTGPPWKISPQDHRQIRSKLDDFTNVLPKGFTLPSRHTLSRFWEGYINGFHEHLPFLHLPTISAVHSSPELILAIAAVGAQYRFEGHRGNALWYASKAIAMEQIRRRSSQQVAEILSPPSTYRSTSAVPSPSISTTMNRTGDMSSEDVKPGAGSRGQSESLADDSLQVSTAFMSSVYPELTTVFDHSVDTPQARMETIQALLLLMAMGTWGPRALLREGLCLRSHVSLLAREMGLNDTQPTPEDISWHDWIQVEAERRTKLIVYCFFGLQCIAYDMPPLLLNAEINLLLPCSAKEWKAENCRAWKEARRSSPHPEVSFPDALAKLFARGGPPGHANIAPVSSMGNYILIHALVQQIFFVRQTSTTSNPGTANNSLRPEDIDELGSALRSWQAGWERTPESSLDPSNPNGPVAFNSTALLRLAYIRLHSDLGPCRRLDTRDPIRIAAAFKNSPPLVRSARLGRAVLQSAHALSIPVRIGIAFVARTQTFSWSIQHSLCNLECAFLLSTCFLHLKGSNGG
jgi:hypothetical protein